MKTKIATALVIIASGMAFASPQATQDWVKRYVSTNTYHTVPDPVTRVATNGSSVVRMTLSFSAAENPALKAVASTVQGIGVGTVFAKDDFGNFTNATNGMYDTVFSCVTTNRFAVERIDGVWTTNRIESVYLFVGSGNDLMGGYLENGRAKLYGMTHEMGDVTLCVCKITDSERRALLTRTVSAFDIVFQTAYAEWIPGEKEYTGETRKVDGGEERKWERHYFFSGTDVPELCIASLTLRWEDGSSNVISFDPVHLVTSPGEGGDMCDGNEIRIDTETLHDRIAKAVDGSELADDWKVFVKACIADGYFDNDISVSCLSAKNAADKGRPSSCPDTGWDFFAKEDEDEVRPSVPDPDPVWPAECLHVRAEGICGAWKCAACKKKLAGPTQHVYQQSGGHCAVCVNTYKGAACTYIDMENASHHHFDGDGDAEGCICVNGKHWPHPGWLSVSANWTIEETVHYKKQKCSRCNYERKVYEGAHGKRPTYETGSVGCKVYENCDVCGKKTYKEEIAHRLNVGFDRGWFVDPQDATKHYRETVFDCERCLGNGVSTSRTESVAHEWIAVGSLVNDGAQGHHQVLSCAKACGIPNTDGPITAHVTNLVLSASPMVEDSYVCECGYSVSVPHRWESVADVHWCVNGGTHLYGAHQWNGDICTVCGYCRSEDPEAYESETWAVTNGCGECFVTYSHSRPRDGGSWGKTHVVSKNCGWGWNFTNERCGCPSCHIGDYARCWCEHPIPTPESWVALTAYAPSNLPMSGSNK